jgi:hypothetical protein
LLRLQASVHGAVGVAPLKTFPDLSPSTCVPTGLKWKLSVFAILSAVLTVNIGPFSPLDMVMVNTSSKASLDAL